MTNEKAKSRVPFISRIKPFVSIILGGTKEERQYLLRWQKDTTERMKETKWARYMAYGIIGLMAPFLATIIALSFDIIPLAVIFAFLIPLGIYYAAIFLAKSEYEKWKLYRE